MAFIRKPAVAGQFYPAKRDELTEMIGGYLAETQTVKIPGKIRALIVPHAGYVYSGQTAAWGYRQLHGTRNKEQEIHHFVLIGPSHQFPFENLIADDHEEWETPLGRVEHRIPKPNELVQVSGLPHQEEHCLEVQMPWLKTTDDPTSPRLRGAGRLQITGFLTGGKVDENKIAEYLTKQYSDSVFIISTDLSHYLPLSEAERVDSKTVKAIEQREAEYFLHDGNTACGRLGVAIALAIAKEAGWRTQIIHYETSAKAFGDSSRVVGYASAVLYEI